MDAPDSRRPPGRSRRRRPRVVGLAAAWSLLILAANLLRAVLAATPFARGGWLAEGIAGPGWLAFTGAALAAAGLAAGVAWPRRTGAAWLLALVALVAANGLLLAVFPTRFVLAWLQTEEVLFYAVGETDRFALTIDDGLDPATTPAILDTLARHGAKATFFVLAATLEQQPALARRCLAEGHVLANHQMTENPAIALTPDALEATMCEADAELRRFAEPRWFRPGGGLVTDRAKQVAPRIGCRVALGSVFPFDSHVRSSRFVAAYVADRTGAGDVVVLHDGGGRGLLTAEALDAALPKLRERRLRAGTLSELIRE